MISDGTCAHCRAGRVSQCQGRALFGYSGVYPRLDGGQAELVRVPAADRCLLALDEAITDEAAIFCADILPTGYASVVRGGVGVGDTVVVLGCGPVGLMAVLCAVGIAGRVIAVDGIEERRELAERLGAEPVDPAAAEETVLAATGRPRRRRRDRGGRGAGRARRESQPLPRSRHDLRGRRALRARLPAEQRGDVREGADAALHDRRSGARSRAAARPRRGGQARPRRRSSPTGSRWRTPRRATGMFDAREATKVVLRP